MPFFVWRRSLASLVVKDNVMGNIEYVCKYFLTIRTVVGRERAGNRHPPSVWRRGIDAVM